MSEYLEDVDYDQNGSTVLLSMKASRDAFLTISCGESTVDYHLAPDDKGRANALKIVNALNAWLEYLRR